MGSGLGKMIAGGAMQGLGEGMVERAEAKRAMAMKLIEEGAKASRERADREFQRGLLSDTQVAEDGTVYGITRGGERKDLKFKGRKSGTQMREERMAGKGAGGGNVDGLSAGDDRLIKRVIERNTSGYLDEEEVDWKAVDKTLREEGRSDLADYLKSQGTGPEVDVESAEYKEAKRRATAEAKERTGLFKSRESEFPETEGSKETFIAQRTDEIYAQLSGKPAAAPQAEAAAPQAEAEVPQAEAEVPGAGTEQDPYKPTTQAQFDSIPSGAVFINPADGRPYRKD